MGYQYEIWCEGNCLRDRTGDDYEVYEDEDEAREEAKRDIAEILLEWGDSEYSESDFDIVIEEVVNG